MTKTTKKFKVGDTVKVKGWTTTGETTGKILVINEDGYYVKFSSGREGGGWSDTDFQPKKVK